MAGTSQAKRPARPKFPSTLAEQIHPDITEEAAAAQRLVDGKFKLEELVKQCGDTVMEMSNALSQLRNVGIYPEVAFADEIVGMVYREYMNRIPQKAHHDLVMRETEATAPSRY